MDSSEIWNKSLQIIRKEVGEGVYDLWFDPIKPSRLDNGTAVLEIPNRFFKEWIEDYHPSILQNVLKRVAGQDIEVKFVIAEKVDATIKKETVKRENRKTRLARKGIHLNPKYTFDNFVVGPSNEFSHAAAKAVSDEPGSIYNPLFIYGGVGLGKTHLITSIGNRVIDKRRDAHIMYISSEQFTNEVISSFRHSKTEEFKEKYRNLDMILIDDIQFIEKKTATQEELFHTLNALYEKNRQIVLSSDRSPKEIKEITDRLRSRFSMGLIADIQPPDVETKIAIISKKADAERLDIPEEVAVYVATKIRSNIREIEGCLIRLGAHSSLTGSPVTLSMAKHVLKDVVTDDDKPLNVETIMKTVADYFGLRVQDIKSKKRTKEIAQPRQIAMYISRELTDSSLSEIGKHMGGKDHATVIYAYKQVESKRASDESYDRMVENLINKLKP
jgi:chromosomal replication initiator protein